MIHELEIDSICLDFRFKRILSDIYISCMTGKTSGLFGRNGEGKTCLMNIIYGTLQVSDKSIRFDKISVINAYKRPELISYLPQFNFIPKIVKLKRIFSDFNLDFSEFTEVFPDFTSKYKRDLFNLSGGERRLIEVYVILKSKSIFTMLDEPFSHLMPLHIQHMKRIILEEKKNKGILITDHIFKEVFEISDNLYLLKNGKTHKISSMSDIELLGYATC